MSLSLDFATPQPETTSVPNAQPVALAQDLRTRLLASPGLSEADRAQLNDLFDRQQRYGLVWEDKPEAVEKELAEHLPILEEVPERAIVANASGSPAPQDAAHKADAGPAPEGSAPQHTLIEGDNLHALTVLNYTHAGLVDVIYIDPLYNTGNKDFIYNDRFVDREDSYRHSKWLSFMAKRLKLARKLLKDTGVIFISIDDNEQAQLKLLCDEVFGEENFVATIAIVNNLKGRSDATHIATAHESLHIYK